jgi:dihydrolipoamide dehydrogenase
MLPVCHVISCDAWDQVEYVKGWGSLASKNEVEVKLLDGGETTIPTKNIIIATGSEVSPLPGIEIDEER